MQTSIADSHGVFSVVVVADEALLAQTSSCPAQGHEQQQTASDLFSVGRWCSEPL